MKFKKIILITVGLIVIVVGVIVCLVLYNNYQESTYLGFKEKSGTVIDSTLKPEPLNEGLLEECYKDNTENFTSKGITADMINSAIFYGYDELEFVHMYSIVTSECMYIISIYDNGDFEIVY